MRNCVGAAAAVLLLLPSSAALAESGTLACELEARDVVEAFNRQSADLSTQERAEAKKSLDVAVSQCRSTPDIAEANLNELRGKLKLRPVQRAYDPSYVEWPNTYD